MLLVNSVSLHGLCLSLASMEESTARMLMNPSTPQETFDSTVETCASFSPFYLDLKPMWTGIDQTTFSVLISIVVLCTQCLAGVSRAYLDLEPLWLSIDPTTFLMFNFIVLWYTMLSRRYQRGGGRGYTRPLPLRRASGPFQLVCWFQTFIERENTFQTRY